MVYVVFAIFVAAQLQSRIQARSKEDKVFVETRAYKAVEEELFSRGAVTIMGDPGEGKTSCAWHLILKCIVKGYQLRTADTAKQFRENWNPSQREIIFADDMFGAFQAVPERAEDWCRLQEDLRGCVCDPERVLLVATVRRHIYRELKEMTNQLHLFGRVIDITSADLRLTGVERCDIFLRHHASRKTEADQRIIEFITTQNTPRFPLSCRLYVSETRFQEQGASFFRNPVSQLRKDISQLSQKDKVAFASLVLLMACDGSIPHEKFQIIKTEESNHSKDIMIKFKQALCCNEEKREQFLIDKMQVIVAKRKLPVDTSHDDFQAALHKLQDVYVLLIDDCYRFVHESIMETVGVVVGEQDCEFVLNYCSAHFIQQRVRAEAVSEEYFGTNDECIVNISVWYYRDLAIRMTSDIMDGNVDKVFQNPSVYNEAFIGIWISYLSGEAIRSVKTLIKKKDRNGHTVMYWAAKMGILSLIDYFLRDNKPTHDALHGACFQGNENIVFVLLDKGAKQYVSSVDSDGVTPLHAACMKGHTELVSVLLRNGADVNHEQERFGSPLHFACLNENIQLVETLLDGGARVNLTTVAGWPEFYFAGNTRIVDMLICNRNHTRLMTNTGWSALHLAAGKGNTKLVKVLIDRGADVNIRTKNGWSAVYCACQKNELEVVRLLVENGADVNFPDHFNVFPLHLASTHNNNEMAELLLNTGADVNVTSMPGYSPLHCSSERGWLQMTELLVSKGATTDLMGKNGKTPILLATQNRHTHIVDLLQSKSSKDTAHNQRNDTFDETDDPTFEDSLDIFMFRE